MFGILGVQQGTLVCLLCLSAVNLSEESTRDLKFGTNMYFNHANKVQKMV